MKPINTEYNETAQVKKIGVDQTVQKVEVSTGAKIGYMIYPALLPQLLVFAPIAWIKGKNNLIAMQRRINDELAAGIDVQLANRRDTLTKLFDQVKGSMKFEKETMTQIAELRSGKITPENRAQIDSMTENISRQINFQMEAYPDLKSTAAIKDLMRASYDIEQDLAASRRTYNSAVSDFNTKINSYPTSVIAASMGLSTLIPFAATVEQRQDVKMEF